MATGLKKRFQTYAAVLLPCALDKFKEKKSNVVAALREAVDAMYLCVRKYSHYYLSHVYIKPGFMFILFLFPY